MSTEFASAGLTAGQLNAIVKKLGGHDMALRFLRDELSVSKPTRSWREEDGVIYLPPLTTDGTTGPEWEQWYDENGYNLSKEARFILNSPDFKPTNGVTTEVAVFNGLLFENSYQITKKVRAEADKSNKLSKPNAELACLIREKFTDKEIEAMGLWYIVAMHEPIDDFDGVPNLLLVGRYYGGRQLDVYYGRLSRRSDHRDYGFAFAVSQVNSQP